MKIENVKKANEIVADVVLMIGTFDGIWSGQDIQITMSVKTTEYTFEKGRDGVWRWTFESTYGNGECIYGAGCDATGFRIDQDLYDALEEIVTENE